MQFQVTEKHIAEGCSGQPEYCPVALSMRENGFPHALVGSTEAYPNNTYHPDRRVDLPERVSRRIKYYDRTGKMKPFGFELALEAPCQTQ